MACRHPRYDRAHYWFRNEGLLEHCEACGAKRYTRTDAMRVIGFGQGRWEHPHRGKVLLRGTRARPCRLGCRWRGLHRGVCMVDVNSQQLARKAGWKTTYRATAEQMARGNKPRRKA